MGPIERLSEFRADSQRRLLCSLFGVRLVSDIHERASDLRLAVPLGAKRRRRLEQVRCTRLLFVHIPKTAGMSISAALYGNQIKHASIRFYRHVDPVLLDEAFSFAVLRDPAERFLSAYRYACAGGSPNNDVAEHFRERYRAFRSIDDALDHITRASSPYAVDHIFRPQRWYITDRAGQIAIDQLVTMSDITHLPLLVPGFPAHPLPELNRSHPDDAVTLSPAQLAKLRTLYAGDFALWETMSKPTRVRAFQTLAPRQAHQRAEMQLTA